MDMNFKSTIAALGTMLSVHAQFDFVTDSYAKEFTFGSTGYKATFRQYVTPRSDPFSTVYEVVCGVILNTSQDAITIPAAGAYGFAVGEPISAAAALYATKTPLTIPKPRQINKYSTMTSFLTRSPLASQFISCPTAATER